MNNTKFWHGLTTQTPTYMRAEGVRFGYFLVIGFRDWDFETDRQDRVEKAARAVSNSLGISVRPIFVDARPKPSASRA